VCCACTHALMRGPHSGVQVAPGGHAGVKSEAKERESQSGATASGTEKPMENKETAEVINQAAKVERPTKDGAGIGI
jgi:hypothetical protein